MIKEHLVIGAGEVGQAIANFLECDTYDTDPHKTTSAFQPEYKYLHICYPYSDNFEKSVMAYSERYRPRLIIIHSTVPIGTSRKLNAVHSPVKGVHPQLVKGLQTFVKYFGGDKAHEAAALFPGLTTECYEKQETTEAIKLWETTQYGFFIILEKAIYEFCRKNGLDFDEVYTIPNIDYNLGYTKLGRTEVVRPFLKHIPGKIGGHCVIPNARLLDSWVARLILEKNEQL